ncbi:MAG: serine/threonine protein kinase, partial [Candidatus Margulisbacteria bacterium]|nr:serine/threonine protein kinase [Candidatus Margulisiibacteriota bacterium]
PDRWNKEQILEEHTFLGKLAANEVPVIPPLKYDNNTLFFFDNIPFAVFHKKGGRALDEFDKESWQEIGRLLGRVHNVGETFKRSERIIWKPEIVTRKNADYLLNGFLPREYQKIFADISQMFIEKTRTLFSIDPIFLIHGDCHKGNLIHRPGEGIFIIDFDDICVGPAVQDLWMLLPGSPEESGQEMEWFLEGYEVFRKFNRASFILIPALKVMRMLHFAAWCALQSKDQHFIEHFSQWGTIKYWNELIKDIQNIVYSLV